MTGAAFAREVATLLSLLICLLLAPWCAGIAAAVRAVLSGQSPAPLSAPARALSRALTELRRGRSTPSGMSPGLALGAAATLAALAVDVMPGMFDPLLAAFLLSGARVMMWLDVRDGPALWFARAREQRGALVVLMLVGMMAGFSTEDGRASVGDVLLAGGVLIALSDGVLGARDPVRVSSQGRAWARGVADLLVLGWILWLARLVWPHVTGGPWMMPAWTIARAVCMAVVLGMAQGMWFPRASARPLASALLLGGLALVLLDLGETSG